MKRGLKALIHLRKIQSNSVTTIAPMKRGLKVLDGGIVLMGIYRYNHCPDEKGTESFVLLLHCYILSMLQPLPR